MEAYINSKGVLIVTSENSTELFAIKNINKVVLIEELHIDMRPIGALTPSKSPRWSRIIEVDNEN